MNYRVMLSILVAILRNRRSKAEYRSIRDNRNELVDLHLTTWVPEKYLMLDLETGDVWTWRRNDQWRRA